MPGSPGRSPAWPPAGPASAHARAHRAGAPAGDSFTTLDSAADPTCNQLLGINNHGVIAGYFGSGPSGHPNQGYRLHPPYGQMSYVAENVPASFQTQVTGLSNHDVSVGFEVDAAGGNIGFATIGPHVETVIDPAAFTGPGGQIDEQLLGVSDRNQMVGFSVEPTVTPRLRGDPQPAGLLHLPRDHRSAYDRPDRGGDH